MTDNDKGVVGFDPLAWMNEETDKTNESDEQIKNCAESTVNIDQEHCVAVDTEVETSPEEIESEDVAISETAEIMDESKIILEETLNIQNVAQLHAQVLNLLDSQDRIEIDASEVGMIDTASIQLLVVLKKTAVTMQKEIIIDFPSDKLIESAELLGVSDILDLDQAAAGLF